MGCNKKSSTHSAQPQPAAKKHGRFTYDNIKELYRTKKEGLAEQYGIAIESFKKLPYADKLKHLYTVMNDSLKPKETTPLKPSQSIFEMDKGFTDAAVSGFNFDEDEED